MVNDRVDEMARSLDRIETLLERDIGDSTTEIEKSMSPTNIGGGVTENAGPMSPRASVAVESSDLDAANADGTITVEPGEITTIVRYEVSGDNGAALLTVGASDESDTEYAVRLDDDILFLGWTESPLGTVNTPFSFIREFNSYVPASRTIEYVALRPESATATDLAARMIVQEP